MISYDWWIKNRKQKTEQRIFVWNEGVSDICRINQLSIFDAALFEGSGCAGIRVAIRDSSGVIIASLSQKTPLPHFVELVEALAARQAVVFAQDMSIFKVLVEGDCLRVVSALRAPSGCHTLCGNVVEDTHRLASHFQFCSFSHVRRHGNMLAHALAKSAVSSADFDVWVEELPLELESVFQTNLN